MLKYDKMCVQLSNPVVLLLVLFSTLLAIS